MLVKWTKSISKVLARQAVNLNKPPTHKIEVHYALIKKPTLGLSSILGC